MTKVTRSALKLYFETGDQPTESEFKDVFDSTLNLSGSNALTGSLIISGSTSDNTDNSSVMLHVMGDITASGNISASGTIFADNFSSTGGNASGIDFTDDLKLTGNLTASGNISASGDVFADNLTLEGALIVDSISASGDLEIRNITASGDISASGELLVDSNITATGNLQINGNSILGNASTNTTTIEGIVSVIGAITSSGDVSGSFTSTGSFGRLLSHTIGGLSPISLTDDTQITGSLVVTENITASGNLSIVGDLEITNITASGDISASGNISANQLKLDNFLHWGTTTGDNGYIYDDGTNLQLGYNDTDVISVHDTGTRVTITGDLKTTSHITASGNISASGTLDITGNVNFDGDLDVDGTTNLDIVDIDGAVDMASTLLVGNTISASNNITGLNLIATGSTAGTGSFNSVTIGSDMPQVGGTSVYITGSVGIGNLTPTTTLNVSGTVSASGGFIGNVIGTSTGLTGTPDIIVGSLTATSITSSIVTSSIVLSEGSNIFGDASDDTHTFNGDITASGNISASLTITANAFIGNITGDVTGNADTSTEATNITAAATTDDAEFFVGVLEGASGTQAVETVAKFKYNPNSGKLSNTGAISASNTVTGLNISATGSLTGTGSFNSISVGSDMPQVGGTSVYITGSVGIGNLTPTTALNVSGAISASGNLEIASFTTTNSNTVNTIISGLNVIKQISSSNLITGLNISATGSLTGTGSFNSVVIGDDMPQVGGTSVYITGSVGIGNLTPTEALNVSGAISASGNILAGKFLVDGEVTADYNGTSVLIGNTSTPLVLRGSSTLINQAGGLFVSAGPITASGNIKTGGNLFLSASSGHVTASGNISSSENITGLNLIATGSTAGTGSFNSIIIGSDMPQVGGTSLFVTGSVGIGNLTPTEALNVSGAISASGDLTVAGASTFSTINATGDTTITGQISSSNLITGLNLTATGSTAGTGSFNSVVIGDDMPIVGGISLYVTGSIGVGNLTPTNALTVSGAISSSKGITAVGTVTAGAITTTGNSNLGNTGDDTHTITGATHVKGNLTGSGGISSSLGISKGISANHYVTAASSKELTGNAAANGVAAGETGTIFCLASDGTAAIVLPDIDTVKIGHRIELFETAGGAAKVFPTVGQRIFPLSTNAPATIPANTAMVLVAFNESGWQGYLTTVIS